jgi:hypothetical protein
MLLRLIATKAKYNNSKMSAPATISLKYVGIAKVTAESTLMKRKIAIAERTATVPIVKMRPRLFGAISRIALITNGMINRDRISLSIFESLVMKNKGANLYKRLKLHKKKA